MVVCCASCQGKFRIDPVKVPPQGTRIRCPKCRAIIAVGQPPAMPDAGAGRPPVRAERAAGTAPPAAPSAAPPAIPSAAATPSASPTAAAGSPHVGRSRTGAPRVVVAHSSAAFCQTLAGFLSREGFAVKVASDGHVALGLIRETRPDILLVDAALPGIIGFALCEQVKSDPALAGTRVILIGAIYDRNRYRRPPQSLYGADDYIEKHRIPDDLIHKIHRLLAPPATPAAAAGGTNGAPAGAARGGEPAMGPHQEDRSADRATHWPDRSKGQRVPGEAGGPGQSFSDRHPKGGLPAAASSAAEQARRLARIIVSDIVLYNPETVQRGLAEGNLLDLLRNELKEGRDLLRARVSPEVAEAYDYVAEALEEYVQRQGATAAKGTGASR